MTLVTVNTEHFSDVEVAARNIANDVQSLQTLISASRDLAGAHWHGEGRNEFDNLSRIIQQLMKDISDEFWDVYETLVDAEGAFLEADQEVATKIDSCIPFEEASSTSDHGGGGTGYGGESSGYSGGGTGFSGGGGGGAGGGGAGGRGI